MRQRTRISLLAAAALAATLLPIGSAAAVQAKPTDVRATIAVTVNCPRYEFFGYYCGYDTSNAYTSRGDSGAKVKELQALLIFWGYSVGSTGIDGSFGAATEAAVKRLQSNDGLKVDGIVGAATWKDLRVM
ncbi:hypothetical protein GCM10010195_44910 [Kitasatospora griseola]|nr:hypothetical protein GCM10010195_44910 [Kitasatospora griseola]